ncbi:MAG: BA14K family protein [Caulobacteraceae bacterium]
MRKTISRGLISAASAAVVLSSGLAAAQPFPGGRDQGRGPPGGYQDRGPQGRGPQGRGPQGGGCFPGEHGDDCRERMRAERRSNRHYVYRDGRYEDQTGAAIAGGILGFMLGAAIAGSSQDRDYYNTHRNDGGWRSRCSKAYRSFDAGTGTYMGADGYRHYCTR